MTVWRGPLRERAAIEAWLGALLLAAVALATALADPAQQGPFPACPFRAVTGLDCPGCGSLRALHQLTHGHVVAAADYNALLLAFLPVAAGVWLRVVTSRSRPRHLPVWWGRAVLAVLFLWTVVRNLPVLDGVLGS
ncbi:DUF2752 domain-containing protein [Streptomyces caniscabiei]|uniref:DUF2752 domain-containing protein n=1 Tax=Streptomyces caniscabiei TaxID=2746961 RepID=UPI001C500A9E|nr:DUF2752 domain-containing protein [Streptomyces caniscabiei]MDX3515996.1 DUF2752 domain-containing protein [Streptomyces caniscabiei]MDX3723639.1 DUF2752 domain-containing protein [Streptomyces caniscabiei]WEO24002.1 DUF2752 domain-containing protein [Streptomyces caniscabiei]